MQLFKFKTKNPDSRFPAYRTGRQIPDSNSGQSLIETLAAIFILTMALTTALGMAVYALSRSNISSNEVIATNLAREGIDVVRGIRDSNWLAGDASTDSSYNLQPCADLNNNLCYPKVYQGPAYSAGSGIARIFFNSATMAWSFDNTADYNLYLQPNGTYTNNAIGTSVFARMINVTLNTAAPYTASNPEVIVKSIVAWRDKNCPAFNTGDDLLALNSKCKVVTEEHLTNWKDYK